MAKARRRRRVTAPEPPESAEKMEEYGEWCSRVARARRVRTDWETNFGVETLENLFIGRQPIRNKDIALNHFWATLKTTRPALYYAAPKFYVRPKGGTRSPIADHVASVGEGVLESIAQQDLHLKRAGRLAVTQSFFRIGVLKVCYDPRLEPNPQAGQPIQKTQDGIPIKDDLGMPVMERDPLTGEVLVEPDDVMTDEVYRWRWVDAANMLLPDEGADPDQWSWIGEEITVPLEDAKDDSRFKKYKDQLTANAYPGLPSERRRRSYPEMDEHEAQFRYVECYDLKEKKVYVWAEGQPYNDFLVNEPLPKWIEDHPYAILILGEPILGPQPCPWPMPPTHPWKDPQSEYNILRKLMIEGAKRSARKMLYTGASFEDEDEAIKALQSSDDMAAAKITSKENAPFAMEQPPLSGDIWRGLTPMQNDWRLITGQTGARLANPDSNTATEAAFAERSANTRESDEKGLVDDWLSIAGRKMFQCVQQTLTMDLWIKLRSLNDKEFQFYAEQILGVPREMFAMMPGLKEMLRNRYGSDQWQQITRDDLNFQATVTVEPGSSRPRNIDVERRQWLELLTILGQAPQLALSPALLDYTASMYEGVPDRVIEELSSLAQKMVQMNANQAGRNQGGTQNGGGANPGASSQTTGVGNLAAALTGVGV